MNTLKWTLTSLLLFSGLLALMARVGSNPWIELPLDGRIAEAYYLDGPGPAVSLYRSDETFPWLYDDLKAAALALFDYSDFSSANSLFLKLQKINPNDVSVAAHRIFLSVPMEKAYDKLTKVYSKPDNPRIRLLLAIAAVKAGKLDEADGIFNTFAGHVERFVEIPMLYSRAELMYIRGNWYESARILIDAIEKYPNFLPNYLLRAKVFIEGNVPDTGLSDLDMAEQLGGDPFAIAYLRGNAYRRKMLFTKAIEQYNIVIKLKPAFADARLKRGDCHRYSGQKFEAIDDFREAYNRDQSLTVALVNLAVVNFELGEYQVSRQFFNEAVDSDPGFASAYIERGNFFAVMGEQDEAEEDYLKAAALTPNDPYPLYRLASMHAGFSNLDKAVQYANEALQRKPEFAPVEIVLGDVARAKGDLNIAIEFYRRALEHDEVNYDAAKNLAFVLMEIRDIRGAYDAAKRAVSLHNKDTASLTLLGMAELGRGDLDRAYASFSNVINMDIGYAPAYYGLALCSLACGSLHDGATFLENAVRWRPDPSYIVLRAMIGIFDPAYSLGSEQEVLDSLNSPSDKLKVKLILAGFERKPDVFGEVARELAKSDVSDAQWLGELLVEQVDNTVPLSRPPSLKPPRRTEACLYLAMLYYARKESEACRSMLTFNIRSNDYLSPEYYFSSILHSRLIQDR